MCIYIHMRIQMCIRTHTCVFVHTDTDAHTHTHTCMHVYDHIHTHMHTLQETYLNTQLKSHTLLLTFRFMLYYRYKRLFVLMIYFSFIYVFLPPYNIHFFSCEPKFIFSLLHHFILFLSQDSSLSHPYPRLFLNICYNSRLNYNSGIAYKSRYPSCSS
jgi:hypothetical protein